MTTRHDEMPILRTDSDVLERVSDLVGPAATDRQLWIMFLDGDGRQTPVVIPIAEMPGEPDPGIAATLAEVLVSLGAELATAQGPGSVLLTWERIGPDRVLPADRAWAGVLAEACETSGMRCAGLFRSTPGGVRPLT